MAQCTVRYTANAGFILTVNQITIAVDAFPQEENGAFCALSPADFQALCQDLAGKTVSYVISTHDHPDHHSDPWTAFFLSQHPESRFLGPIPAAQICSAARENGYAVPPSNMQETIFLHTGCPTYYFPNLTLEFIRLPHEGAEYASVINYGCLLTFSDSPGNPYRVLFLGDARPVDPDLIQWISGRSIDLALLNFPWITIPANRRLLTEQIAPAKLGILHLPYDTAAPIGNESAREISLHILRTSYRNAARKAADTYFPQICTLFIHCGQTIDFT